MKKLLITLMLLFPFVLYSQQIPRAHPEQVGIDGVHLSLVDGLIQSAIDTHEIPGAVIGVVKDGCMVYKKAYGNKQVYPRIIPMTDNTVFDLASVSKSISTAIAVMILVERGVIRLIDPVKYYVPDFDNYRDTTGQEVPITVMNLLTHSSGLPPYAPVEDLKQKYGAPNPDGLIDYISHCPRHYIPGKGFDYSCLNFIMLQRIVEKVSGMNLADFAARNIFGVLGMIHTCYTPGVMLRPLCAPTEKQPDGRCLQGQVHDPLARIMNGGVSGNAGVFSDVEDLAILVTALMNGGEYNHRRILSPASVKLMTSVQSISEASGRTPGWSSSRTDSNMGDLFGSHTYGHTGYTGTSVTIDPDTRTAVILLTNRVHPADTTSVSRLRWCVSNVVASSVLPIDQPFPLYYYARMQHFSQEPALSATDVIFLGDSLTEGGDWCKLLRKKHVVNRGISGDTGMGIYSRLADILPAHPRKIFLMCGVNDISHGLSADSIVSLIDMNISRIQYESPETKLYLQSLLPINESFGRWKKLEGKTDLIPEINQKLEVLAKDKKIPYIDLFPLFVEPGTHIMRKELTKDGLHLNDTGYGIWSKVLKRYL
ncbi:serine hydrolase [Porphyromonas pogonae]|uniref:serine hydrolase n=1 Tax=Porphyromonas pogonae TaxID=867595 RepID=UPI002E796702|nr:serine hydrolase [Porphyromonas pogonae]